MSVLGFSSTAVEKKRIALLWFVTMLGHMVTPLRRGVSAWVAPTISRNQRSLATAGKSTMSRRVQGHQESRADLFQEGRKLSIRWMASQVPDEDEESKPSKKYRKKKKFTVVDEIGQEQLDKLAAAFDDMARKEGFDSSTSFFADDGTFEDEFSDDDYLDDDDDDESELTDIQTGGDDLDVSTDVLLDASQFDLSDFSDDAIEDDDGDDLFFGGSDDDDMDARIAAARSDIDMGRVSVPSGLDSFANDLTHGDVQQLGFREEPEEPPSQKTRVKLVSDAMVCSACGADFQTHDEKRPGFLPAEKFSTQVKLSKIEEMQNLQEKADSNEEWSTDDEIEWLLQTSGTEGSETIDNTVDDIDIENMAKEMGLNLEKLSNKKVICKRCHGLQNFGKVDESLRPGWTKEPQISQEKFMDLLRPLREKEAVIIALVDVFDFSGSVLPELDNIAGDNPVILAANKADLLPSKMGQVRVENWVRRELEYLGVKSIANIGGAVRLVSCKTGLGVGAMLDKARKLAEETDCDIYVVGAANAGKSTLLNHILARSNKRDGDKRGPKIRAGNANAHKGEVTTSPLPGTTLRFIKVDLGEGRYLYDTPGLLVPGTLTQLLTPEELKIVVPNKRVEPITFRLEAGKCVLVGGLAKIELVGDSRPFLFTFFVANDIKLHVTSGDKADDFIRKHAGEMLTPPLAPGNERLEQIGEFKDHVSEIEGAGWKEAAADITFTGLGWVAVTGAGTATVKISVPKDIGVSIRPPLMPFDIWDTTARYTGSRAVRKSTKSANGKRRKGVGRR